MDADYLHWAVFRLIIDLCKIMLDRKHCAVTQTIHTSVTGYRLTLWHSHIIAAENCTDESC